MKEFAITFAAARHGSQMYGDQPYIVHPLRVMEILQEHGYVSDIMQAAGALHDVVEDTKTSLDEILGCFGQEVANLVDAVTKPSGRNRTEKNALSHQKMIAYPPSIVLKQADLYANGLSSRRNNQGLYKMYRREYPIFRSTLKPHGGDEALWEKLDQLFEEKNHGDAKFRT